MLLPETHHCAVPMLNVHPAAADGFASAADTYARARPEYPAAIDPWLRDTLGLGEGRTVLDLGAGTGKFTRSLLTSGARVIAVDAVPAMLEQLTARFATVATHVAIATELPLPDLSVDAVVCAQSFHWFATSEALAEIHRVLKPGGLLGLIWNVRDESVDWVRSLTEIFAAYEGDAPRYRTMQWQQAFADAAFGPLSECVFANDHHGPAEQVILGRFLSTSFIAALPDAERAIATDKVRALIAATPALQGADAVFPYRTHAFHCRKIG